jgi:hypothetical protein
VNECNESINVLVMDDPGCGGACHHYRIEPITLSGDHPEGAINPCEIRFQHGPIAEVGVNGVTHESLLAVLEDRLSSFQDGPYACEENRQALFCIRSAKEWLHRRTKNRLERGVEGTHQV